jgi:D-aminoacyl-tRNA deacylase
VLSGFMNGEPDLSGVMRRILISRADGSSMLVRSYLLEVLGFEKLEVGGQEVLKRGEVEALVLEGVHLYLNQDELRKVADELIVVASTHRSEQGVNALTVHATGNWTSEATYGGLPRALSYTMAGAIRTAFDRLREEAASERSLEGWWVGLEVTHHGPFSEVPLIYVEFGGDEAARSSGAGAAAVAEACVAAVTRSKPSDRAAVGVGGGHYAPAFTRSMSEDRYDFGHILPKYAMPEGLELLGEAVRRTVDGCRTLVIDWKGVPGAHRQAVLKIAEYLGLEAVRI